MGFPLPEGNERMLKEKKTSTRAVNISALGGKVAKEIISL